MSNVVPGIEPQTNSLVREIARQSNQPLEDVRSIYEAQFRHLESQARIRTYLPILAARRTREILSAG